MESESKGDTERDTILSLRRKVNALENERLNVVSSSNEEISRLLSEIARMTAQSERGEALRQNLEYELARAKKDALIEKQIAQDRDSEIKKLMEEYSRKEEKIVSDKKSLTRELEAIRAATQEDISRFAIIMQEKERQLSSLLKEKDHLISEKSELTLTIKDRDRMISEYKAELERLTDHREEQETTLRAKVQKVEQLRDKCSVLEQELLMTLNKVESLETEKEVEKTNHFQAKYSCEILQNELKTETAAKTDALLKLEKVQNQMRQFQESLQEEKDSSSKLQEKLADLKMELENVNKRLSFEVTDKKQLVKSYSQQLDECQKTVIQLKQELTKAKKKQTQLDEAYDTGLKELQDIASLFNQRLFPSSTSSAPALAATVASVAKEATKVNAFCSTASIVRQIFHESLLQNDKLSADLSSRQQMIEQLAKECKSYKLKMSTSARACQVSDDALEKSRSEKKQLESQCRSLKDECSRLQKELSTLKSSLAKEKSCSQELHNQMTKLSARYQNDEQRSSKFVLLLHQLLNTVDAVAAAPSVKCSVSKDGALPKWNELGLIVNEQVSSLVNLLNQEKEKVSRTEELLRQKERALEQLNIVHDEELANVAEIYKSANQQWAGEKEELQKQYAKKLLDIQSKHKVSAEETWQKLETANSFQQELEQDREKLRSELNTCRIECRVLLATCALLCGTIYPLHARYVTVVEQRDTLSNQLVLFESFKNQVKNLVVAISGNPSDCESKDSVVQRSNAVSKLRFRIAVIAMIAVGRLSAFARSSCRMFTSFNALPVVYATAVCFGGSKTPSSSKDDGESSDVEVQDRLVSWLSSADLQSAIHLSMEGLITAAYRVKEGASGYDGARLTNIAKNCFQKFLSFLPKMFPHISIDRDSHNMCTQLGKGLESCLESRLNDHYASYVNSQKLAKTLQQELLSFTQRLHSSELERRDLRASLSLIERGDAKHEKADQLQAELTSLRKQFETAVPVSKFTQVCEELARALEREQQLQTALEKQKEQLNDQSKRLHILNNKGDLQENLSVKHSSDLRVELHSKDQLVQRLTRQIAILDEEKSSLLNRISDAEHTLHVASREKQVVISYVNTLTNWFKQLPSSENGKWDIGAVLNFELSDAKPIAELSAVRCLLSAFVETLNSVFESFSCNNYKLRDKSNGKTNQKFPSEIRISRNKEPFHPFVADSDPGPLKVKLSVKESKSLQKKTTDKKPKSKLPRHQGLRVLTRKVMTSHRYPSFVAVADSTVSSTAASRNASKLVVS